MEVKYFLWNVTFSKVDAHKFYEYMNSIRPGSYNQRREYRGWLTTEETTMVELTEEEALVLTLGSPIKLKKIEI